VHLELNLKEILSNPLLLLVVGGIITGLLIPYITTQWQNHQIELQIKTTILGKISQALAALLVARENMDIYNEGTRISNNTPDLYQKQAGDWKISSAGIGSELSAYFPEDQITSKWDRFVNLTTLFYALAGLTPDYRAKTMQEIQQILNADSNADSIVDELTGYNNASYFKAKKILEQ
jgi:hypothetical protein